MRKTDLMFCLFLFSVPIITVFPDTVDFRIEDETAVWRIGRSCEDTRIVCTGSFRGIDIDPPGFALNWKGVTMGRMMRAGILREIAGPFSLSVRSEGFYEESGFKPDFSLEPVKGWGAALRVPMSSAGNTARMGTMMYDDYSCFWLTCPMCVGCTLLEPFIVVSLKGDREEDELVSEYSFQLHADTLLFTGLHMRASEGGCSIDLLLSRVESGVGVPGMFLRYHIKMGKDDMDGFNCKLLARKSSDTYPAIDGNHVPEEADLHIRGEYVDASWRCFAGGGMLRKKKPAVPDMCIDTERSLSAGFRIYGEHWKYSFTTDYRAQCSAQGETTVSGEHNSLIKYSRSDWWMEFAVSMYRDGGRKPKFRTGGEFGLRRRPLVMQVRGDSDGSSSLRFDYFPAKIFAERRTGSESVEQMSGFLCLDFDAGGEYPNGRFGCTSVSIGWQLRTP